MQIMHVVAAGEAPFINAPDSQGQRTRYWSTIENLDLRDTARVSVCLSVCLSVTRDLRNRSMDHSEILGDVRGQYSKNRHTAAFF